MPLDRVLARLRQRITPTRRAAFLACFIAGYLIHLFAFSNIIPNSDGLSRVFDPQQMTVSGRWFLHYASFLNDFTQMPALIGFFSMVFLSLAAAGVVTAIGFLGVGVIFTHGRTVSGVTNDELDSLAATDAIAEAIRRRLGKRLQMSVADHHARKLRLRRQLGLPVGYD